MDWNFPNIYNWNTAFGASQVCPGNFAGSRGLHVGESLLCFQSDRDKPCSAIWKRNERADVRGQPEQGSCMDGSDFDGNWTALSTPYMLESFQINKLEGKLSVP